MYKKVYVTTSLTGNQLFKHYFWFWQKQWSVGETVEWRPWSFYDQQNRIWLVANSFRMNRTIVFHLTPTTSKMLSVGENIGYNDKQLGVMS